MSSVDPQQWQEWKRSKVTIAVMDLIRDRIEDAKDQLIGPSNDRDFDQYVKGMIRAFNEVIDVQLDLFTEEEQENEISPRDIG